ncbi:hypothetical protein BDB00DRAFT_903252 [Zychaea mexicana]|uniref:uncharacterized protein n=1 Tax=Zychaea mexicana TaxID=64656 RepID=UPI0022FE7814|nr:uncharacterized protein BDB00DRAFT_903252 [Zychaea mexicana]KAI9494312.1 hypothetical protein BDB00DRAFT_903252 [Zychaea mexicana]
MPVLASGPSGPLYGLIFSFFRLHLHQVHHAIFSLVFLFKPSSVSSHVIIACILHGLWSAHWRYVFDQVPFIHDTICCDIHFLVTSNRPLLSYEPLKPLINYDVSLFNTYYPSCLSLSPTHTNSLTPKKRKIEQYLQ